MSGAALAWLSHWTCTQYCNSGLSVSIKLLLLLLPRKRDWVVLCMFHVS